MNIKDSLLELDSVSVTYDREIVLEDIDFRVRENDFIGVIGPNGGGKTTLLKVILGLLPVLKGKISFRDDMLNMNSIGYLPQVHTGDAGFPVSVTDVVMSGMMIRKKIISRMSSRDREKAHQIIGELGLAGMENSSLDELSGGQLQRVFLGRAIIGDPKLLLLDEPGNFVDSTFENDFYGKLRDLNKRMAILMVSHDIGIISSYVKSYACVNRKLHYHPEAEITNEQLLAYGCPIKLITHGDVPHTVLKAHS
ncbi:MAG TPA: ABC transporter ATP-binding protein [Bacteroidales bacterium]|nr:ABC transporter ATP-binding protein [Bacteroidales bacterium]HPR13049.1 ABC transporter ATP-binding protein [Bacteroidales bacterium]